MDLITHIAGIVENDTANAPGICVSVYVSGCDFHCKGCHNPETWNFNYGFEATEDTIYGIEESLHANGINRSLSILGGETMHPNNIAFVWSLISFVRYVNKDKTKIYLWSGYTFEELIERSLEEPLVREILENIDVLIDGPYIEEQRDITLKMRGSKNQRIHYLGECYESISDKAKRNRSN